MIVRGLPFPEYLASKHIRSGQINDFIDNGPDYFHRKNILRTVPDEDTTPRIIGRAVHCLRCEGMAVFMARYRTIDLASRRSKAWDEFKAKCKADGLEALTKEEAAECLAISQAVDFNADAVALLAVGEGETTIRRDVTRYGLPLQCRPDWLNLKGCDLSGGLPYYVSLKTTADCARLANDIAGMAYYRTEAYYRWMIASELAVQADGVVPFLVGVEKSEPFRCRVYRFGTADLDAGWLEMDAGLQGIRAHTISGVWPRNTDGVQTWNMPEWIRNRSMRPVEAMA